MTSQSIIESHWLGVHKRRALTGDISKLRLCQVFEHFFCGLQAHGRLGFWLRACQFDQELDIVVPHSKPSKEFKPSS